MTPRALESRRSASFTRRSAKKRRAFRVSALFFHAEDLNFHRCGRGVIDRRDERHARHRSFVSSNRRSEHTYRPAWWVPGGHAQTLWAKFFRRRQPLTARRNGGRLRTETLSTCTEGPPIPSAPRLLLLHGLEGPYGRTTSRFLSRSGASRMGRRPSDISRVRRRAQSPLQDSITLARPPIWPSSSIGFVNEYPSAPLVLAGVSLGGNVLLKFLGEVGERRSRGYVAAAAAISVPFDLERGARFIAAGILADLRSPFLALASTQGAGQARRVSRASLIDPDCAGASFDLRLRQRCDCPRPWVCRCPRLLQPVELDPVIDRIRAPDAAAERDRRSLSPVRRCSTRSESMRGRESASAARIHGARRPRWFRRRSRAMEAVYYAEWRACEFLASRRAAIWRSTMIDGRWTRSFKSGAMLNTLLASWPPMSGDVHRVFGHDHSFSRRSLADYCSPCES